MRRLWSRLLGLLLAATLAAPAEGRDPRWVFYTKDKHHYTSPWFQGAHRIMVPFRVHPGAAITPPTRGARGRPRLPPRLDVAMPCGHPLYAGPSA